MTTLVPMSATAFVAFERDAVQGYAEQNVAAGRWPAETAMELSRAEHRRLLPEGVATRDAHLFEIHDAETNAAVGTLWLAVQNTTGTPTGYVFNVEIIEKHRRKGHAKAALKALESYCRERGVSSLGLNVFAFNTAARSLYESLGYEATAITLRKTLPDDAGAIDATP